MIDFQRPQIKILAQRMEDAEHVPPGGRREARRPRGWSFDEKAMKRLAYTLVMALLLGCSTTTQSLDEKQISACAAFRAKSGHERLAEAESLGSILPLNRRSATPPFKLSPDDIEKLLGHPDTKHANGDGQVTFNYNLLSSDGHVVLNSASLIIWFSNNVIWQAGIAKEI